MNDSLTTLTSISIAVTGTKNRKSCPLPDLMITRHLARLDISAGNFDLASTKNYLASRTQSARKKLDAIESITEGFKQFKSMIGTGSLLTLQEVLQMLNENPISPAPRKKDLTESDSENGQPPSGPSL